MGKPQAAVISFFWEKCRIGCYAKYLDFDGQTIKPFGLI